MSRPRHLLLSAVALAGVGLVVSACGATAPSPGGAPVQAPTSTSAGAAIGSSAGSPTTSAAPSAYGAGTQRLTLTVDGAARTAVLAAPADLTRPAPLVFAFHGHGGSAANLDRKMDIDGLWPEAIVVYPDGVVGYEGKTDPEGVKTGWQTKAGEAGDQDIEFYDALLADITGSLPVDRERIFVMGHSNGSAFTSLLLDKRGESIAATATLASQPGRFLDTAPLRSMFLMMGEQDPVVPYDNQKRSIPLAEAKVGVDLSAATTTVDGYLRSATGPGNHELATYVHPAGHEVPPEVPALVVDFFQRHTLSSG